MGANSRDFLEQRELEESIQPKELDLRLNKTSLTAKIAEITENVNLGFLNPLEAFIYLNWMMKVAEGAKKKLLDEALAEAEKYPEKEAEVYDATVTVKNSAGRYTYPDSVKKAREQAKDAYKAQKDGNTIVDDNGEVVEPAVYVQGKTILNIKFK